MFKKYQYLLATLSLSIATTSFADATIEMHFTTANGIGKSAGTVVISETKYGLLFTPHLTGLTPGVHGFHVHEKPFCDKNGMSAGGHFDPSHTEKHRGPYADDGHLGDLPALTVNADGTSTLPVLAPRLHIIDEIKNHALMIHAGGDNYSDTPKLGGGGDRMICGIIK